MIMARAARAWSIADMAPRSAARRLSRLVAAGFSCSELGGDVLFQALASTRRGLLPSGIGRRMIRSGRESETMLEYTVAGFAVGALVGMTGMGGGSLMTPLLILIFGVAPATAVGTDLLFAAATKSAGSFVHGVSRTIDWRIVRRLAAGSVPGALITLLMLSHFEMAAGGAHLLIMTILTAALLATAGILVARPKISELYSRYIGELSDHASATATAGVGLVLGIVVTICSVGAGAIGVTALVLLYPKTPTVRIVGSDIAHAVPLTLLAGIGHGVMGSLDVGVLVALLLGSLPGIFVGSMISTRVPDLALRLVLAGTLMLVGGKLAADVHADWSATIAASMTPR